MNTLRNKYIYIAFLLFFICYSETSKSKTNITEEQKKQIEILTDDMLMAPDFELNSMDDKKYKLSDLKGNVVILNFWATWCGPCRMEIPDFNELYLAYKDEGFSILGISTTDTKKMLKNFLHYLSK